MAQAVNDTPATAEEGRQQAMPSSAAPVNSPSQEEQQPATPSSSLVSSPQQELPIRGRFSSYTAPYLRLILPLLTSRYIIEGIERINPFNMLNKNVPFDQRRYWQKNFFALGWGAVAAAVTGLYTQRTYKDIRTVFAEAVGYELNKDPKDVGFWDLQKSQNPLTKTTMKALINRTAVRFSAVSSLFVPWHLFNRSKKEEPSYRPEEVFGANPRVGTGILAFYLFTDSFTRTESLFEVLQETISQKINHSETNPYDIINSQDIGHMLILYKTQKDKNYEKTHHTAETVQETMALSAYIADIMNKTYDNTPNPEGVSFTLGKFLYLLGNGMLDSFPINMAYAELASRSPDMKAVNAVADAIRKGANPQDAFAPYGIQTGSNPARMEKPEGHQQDEPVAKYTDRVLNRSANRIPAAARTPQEFAAMQDNGAPSVSQ